MSGTTARESYRSGKRMRPVDSHSSRMTPPVLFRLPSIAMPSQDAEAHASNLNTAAVAMPMAAAVAMPASPSAVPAPTPAPAATAPSAPSAPAQSAAATLTAEKAAGQRMLNMLIIALLLAALAIVVWVSLNRGTPAPAMAEKNVGNDVALETLGNLKVPEVTPSSPNVAAKLDANTSTDELQPSQNVAIIDLPAGTTSALEQPKNTKAEPESLLSLDASGVDAAIAARPSPTANVESSPTAQIQLKTPVPFGASSGTALVDAQKPATGLSLAPSTAGSSNSARVETVSTPTQPTKVFPATIDPARPSTTNSSNSNTSSSGGSPSVWDGAQQPSVEGLQLSQKNGQPNSATATSSGAGLNISNPLSREIPVGGQSAEFSASELAQLSVASQGSGAEPQAPANVPDVVGGQEPGVTVGGGAKEPYTLKNERTDLIMMAKIAAARAQNNKGAVGGSTTPTQRINNYQDSQGMVTSGTVAQNQKPVSKQSASHSAARCRSHQQIQLGR